MPENPKPQATRSAGVLLHPTSLPGPFGIGDLGPNVRAWIDLLVRAKQTWWQILPLGPTGYGDSPYQCFSALAGNPYLVSPEELVQDGLLGPHELSGQSFPADRVNFGPVIQFKNDLLRHVWERFKSGTAGHLRPEYEQFLAEQAHWLEDFALFMALKDSQGGRSWYEWDTPLVMREPQALLDARQHLADAVGLHQFRQFLFFRQWRAVKQYANERAVRLMGDAPIFVSSDSADVWANPGLFLLDENRRPRVVAGVPPDYFSATGQLWGNPLYDWDAMRRTGYAWWMARLRASLELVDLVRLDHFRGFEAYWEVPAGEPTAENGQWVKGPGAELFQVARVALGGLPLVAEDLGLITPEVEALRVELELPGMRVLQFAFGGDHTNPYLPHNYEANTVAYTGTHDNDTTRGWFTTAATDNERDHLRRYLDRDGSDITWDLIRAAWSSVAALAIAPLQDVLDLGSDARMNLPGRPDGNWSWRLREEQMDESRIERLIALTELYGRAPAT